MENFTFPLPAKNLHQRFDPVFSALEKGLSVTLCGYPKSSRSAYLKFILQTPLGQKEFQKNLKSFENTIFIFFDEPKLTIDKILKKLCLELKRDELIKLLEIGDQYLCENKLFSYLSDVTSQKNIILVFYETEKQISDPETTEFLGRLWRIRRIQPQPLIKFLLICAPVITTKKSSPHFNPIRISLEEAVIDFPLFTTEELDYTKRRLEYLTGKIIDPKIHNLACSLSGGHYVLYKLLVNFNLNDLFDIVKKRHHPTIQPLLEEIWEGLDPLRKMSLPTPLLPPKNFRQSESEINIKLTAQQNLVFNYLLKNQDHLASRDELAGIIWGKLWQEKYSDWAIDRTISQLKKNLQGTKFGIISVRNRGYKIGEYYV